jgi:hypothetical protein
MVLRRAKKGGVFWGCREFGTLGCRGTRGYHNPNACSPVEKVKYP